MRRNIFLPFFVVIWIGIAITACTRVRVSYHSDPHWQHQGLRTYSWKPAPPPLGDPRLNEKAIGAAIQRSADASLAKLGYQRAGGQPADFEMAYRLGFGQSDREPPAPDPSTAGEPAWLQFWENAGTLDAGPPNERSIILYAVDPTIHRLVWQGVGYAYVDWTASTETHRQRAASAAEKILAGFPRAEAAN